MAFRDDREALRQQVRVLREDVEALADTVRSLESALETKAREVASTARAKRGKRSFVMVLSILIAAVSVVVVFLIGGASGAEAEMLFGQVRSVTGRAPAQVGNRCTLFISPSESEEWNRQIDVLCDGRVVYGGGSLGHISCSLSGGRAERCTDSDPSPDGGDPRLQLDRSARLVRIDDAPPPWTIEIELTTPPEEVRP
jgi:hypothetical protein